MHMRLLIIIVESLSSVNKTHTRKSKGLRAELLLEIITILIE
jgi:hypothetical protein